MSPPAGNLDTTFDSDGKVTTAILSWDDEASAMAIQRDGKIVVAGSVWNGYNYDFTLARYWGLLSPPKIYLPLLLRQ